MRRLIATGLLMGAALTASGQAGAPKMDTATIIRRSVQAAESNYQSTPRYNYFKVVRDHNSQNRTYEEIMLAGSRYSRLVAVNGAPLSPDGEAEEQRKLEATARSRSRESAEERAKRVGRYEHDRQRDQDLLMEMVNAFDFTQVGEAVREGHEVYVLKAKPRKGYRPPNNRAKVLTGMEGTLWIEKNTFQWVRVEAEVIHPVSIEGFLARVQRGTRVELDQMPVTGGVWLPRHFAMRSHARILFLFSKNDEEDEDYYGYAPVPASDAAAR